MSTPVKRNYSTLPFGLMVRRIATAGTTSPTSIVGAPLSGSYRVDVILWWTLSCEDGYHIFRAKMLGPFPPSNRCRQPRCFPADCSVRGGTGENPPTEQKVDEDREGFQAATTACRWKIGRKDK